ncbi:MAG TPA: hypothetical protein VGG78_01720 [Gemmatimonadaceae bacterium]|jgi:hypothetical protein
MAEDLSNLDVDELEARLEMASTDGGTTSADASSGWFVFVSN